MIDTEGGKMKMQYILGVVALSSLVNGCYRYFDIKKSEPDLDLDRIVESVERDTGKKLIDAKVCDKFYIDKYPNNGREEYLFVCEKGNEDPPDIEFSVNPYNLCKVEVKERHPDSTKSYVLNDTLRVYTVTGELYQISLPHKLLFEFGKNLESLRSRYSSAEVVEKCKEQNTKQR